MVGSFSLRRCSPGATAIECVITGGSEPRREEALELAFCRPGHSRHPEPMRGICFSRFISSVRRDRKRVRCVPAKAASIGTAMRYRRRWFAGSPLERTRGEDRDPESSVGALKAEPLANLGAADV
jgi:hypothetical protein